MRDAEFIFEAVVDDLQVKKDVLERKFSHSSHSNKCQWVEGAHFKRAYCARCHGRMPISTKHGCSINKFAQLSGDTMVGKTDIPVKLVPLSLIPSCFTIPYFTE